MGVTRIGSIERSFSARPAEMQKPIRTARRFSSSFICLRPVLTEGV